MKYHGIMFFLVESILVSATYCSVDLRSVTKTCSCSTGDNPGMINGDGEVSPIRTFLVDITNNL